MRCMSGKKDAVLWTTLVLAATVFFLSEAVAQTELTNEYELQDFQLTKAADLMDVCTLERTHPDHLVATAFCYGFFEGGIRYDQALESSPDYKRIVCPPDNATRTQAVEAFIAYMKANPQHATDMPIDAIFRALVDKWPCTS